MTPQRATVAGSQGAPPPPVHPYAALYPLLTEPELEALAEDIRVHGQHEPVVMRQGVLIDGRNRWLACIRAGSEPTVREYDDAADGPVEDFIDSQNLHRRHLTSEQRALAGVRVLERLVTAGRARREANLRRGGAAPEEVNLTPSGRSIEAAARIAGSSPGSIKAARKILGRGTPELLGAVTVGEISLSTGAVLADLAPEAQREAVAAGGRAAIAIAREHAVALERAGGTGPEAEPVMEPAPAADAAVQPDTPQSLPIQLLLALLLGEPVPPPKKPRATRVELAVRALDRLPEFRQCEVCEERLARLAAEEGER